MPTVTKTTNRLENLCDTCLLSVPECQPDEGLMEYGDGLGGDNVIACDAYTPKEREAA